MYQFLIIIFQEILGACNIFIAEAKLVYLLKTVIQKKKTAVTIVTDYSTGFGVQVLF